MRIEREEHDATISTVEARIEARVSRIEAVGQATQEEVREFRKEMRAGMRLAMGMFVTILITIVSTGITTGVALHQSMKRFIDSMLAAFATDKAMQPTIHVIPHAISPVHNRQVAVGPDGHLEERLE